MAQSANSAMRTLSVAVRTDEQPHAMRNAFHPPRTKAWDQPVGADEGDGLQALPREPVEPDVYGEEQWGDHNVERDDRGDPPGNQPG